MEPTFVYDKAAGYFHKTASDLAIDYNKIAVTNGSIQLERNIDVNIENGTREYQNNVTLETARVTSNGRFFDKIFLNCENLEEAHIEDEEVIDISSAFRNTKVTACVVPRSVRTASFAYCNTPITAAIFEAPNLMEMKSMFQDCVELKAVDATNLGNVISADSAFCNCRSLTSINIELPNTNDVKSAFAGCIALKDVHLKIAGGYVASLFQGCSELSNVTLDITGPVISTAYMFKDSGIESYVLDFDTSYTYAMVSMFENCKYLQTIDLKGINTSNVGFFGRMFKDCASLKELDISSFSFKSLTKFNHIGLLGFLKGTHLEKLIIKKEWVTLTWFDADNRLATIAGEYQIPYYVTYINDKDDIYELELSETPIGENDNLLTRGINDVGIVTTTWAEALQTATVEDNTLVITSDVTGDITDTDLFEYENLKFVNSNLYNVHFKNMNIKRLEFENSELRIVDQYEPTFQSMNIETISNMNVIIFYMNANADIPAYHRTNYNLFENCDNLKYWRGDTSITSYYLTYSSQYLLVVLNSLLEIDNLYLNCDNKYSMDKGGLCVIQTPNLKHINLFKGYMYDADIEAMFDKVETIGTVELYGNCEDVFAMAKRLTSIDALKVTGNATNMCVYDTALEYIGRLEVKGDSNSMFIGCSNLKTIDYIKLDTDTETWNLSYMFEDCTSLNITADNFHVDQYLLPINSITANSMFKNAPINAAAILAKLFGHLNLSSRPFLYINNACENTASNVSDFKTNATQVYADYLFAECDIETVNMEFTNAASVVGLFKNCRNLNRVVYLNIKNNLFDSIAEMFAGCEKLTSIRVLLNEANIFNAAYLFDGCKAIYNYGILHADNFINLKDATGMYRDNILLKEYVALPEMVLHTSYTFYNTAIESVGDVFLPATDDISYMFAECKALKSIDSITVFNAEIKYAFSNCKSLESIGLFDLRTTLNTDSHIFEGCDKLQLVQLSKYLHITTIDGDKILYYQWNNSVAANCKVFEAIYDNMDIFKEI